MKVDWRPFLREPVNIDEDNTRGDERLTSDYLRGPVLTLAVAEASKRQGLEKFYDFHMETLLARHVSRIDVTDIDIVLDIAKKVNLDGLQLREDAYNDGLIRDMLHGSSMARDRHGVFGVPTFLFPNGRSAFLKMICPSKEESIELYEGLIGLMSKWHNVGEIKRPQPPWPAVTG